MPGTATTEGTLVAKKKTTTVIAAPFPGASDLPEMDGVQPVGVITKIKGNTQTIGRAIHYGERGVSVVEWQADDVAAKRTKDGMKRQQTLTTLEVHDLTTCPACKCDLLVEARAERRRLNPQLSIEDVDQGDQRKAADGVALTPDEEKKLAAFNGDVDAAAEIQSGRPPWDGYETLGVGAIKNRLDQTDDRMLVLIVGAFEDANKKRAGVLEAVTRRSAQLLAEGK